MVENSHTVESQPAKRLTADDIAVEIEAAIQKRALGPGDRIGAERELAQIYNVSRWIIRRALEQLERRDRILRTHGRSGGVFVAPSKIARTAPLIGLPQYLETQGIQAGTTVLSTRAGLPEEEIANQLGLAADAWVFSIERLRLVGGLPLVLEISHFPCALFPGLLDQPLVGSLLEILETRYDVHRGTARESITATSAGKEEASVLQVPLGAPLLSIRRKTELRDGRPFEYSRELHRSDRMSITVSSESPDEDDAHAISRHLLDP